jgi:hypothetical protein
MAELIPPSCRPSALIAGGPLQIESDREDYRRCKYRSCAKRFLSGKTAPLGSRALALCRLLKTKDLALLPANTKGPNAIASN